MTQAFDAAVRAVREAEDKSPISLDDCADMFARAALRAALPAEPKAELIEAMKIAYIAAIVQPDRWERTYRAIRAHLLGEDA